MHTTRALLNQIIFGTDTRAGRLFDLCLIACILLSVIVALLDSIGPVSQRFHRELYALEWLFTVLFSVEYLLRLYSSAVPQRYARSFFGVVDLLSILPAYLSLLFPGASYLLVLRLCRMLRIFRILRLVRFTEDANLLLRALVGARRKIVVFLVSVLILNVIFGSLMYVVEGPENGFTSIPVSIYWSIVTLTTVGYGDISPHTDLGRFIASLSMITGYAIIAVPTGIVSSELVSEHQRSQRAVERDYSTRCGACGRRGHDRDADYCKQCGTRLPVTTAVPD